MMVDSEILSALYTGRLQYLRERAENCGISKTGSVEVLRARLICNEILSDLDLSWEGIQSMPHKEIGEVLKVFGIKSSGSHKERRQRLWLHLNFDSRRMTIENLAEMSRDNLHELCKSLELDLTGNRTVLMGRVAGVLTSQINGWGRIKRSLRRNGIRSKIVKNPLEFQNPLEFPSEEDSTPMVANVESFSSTPSEAILEDARDLMILGIDKQNHSVQGDLLTIQARVEDLERMVGTILRIHRGTWGESQKTLLLRLATRRGWPISKKFVSDRLLIVATNMAEVKGADNTEKENPKPMDLDSDSIIERVRSKLSDMDSYTD